MNESIIGLSSSYKDLGIAITQTLSWSSHVEKICCNAYRSLHVIKRNIPPFSAVGLKKRLYLTLVRSHLSYSSQLWRPHLAKDITNLERVQRRATKFILQNKSLDYKERLVSLLLLPINMWLECLKDPPDNFGQYVSFCKANTRSSAKGKMEYHYKRTSLGRHYYFNRVVRLWNALPEIELEASARLIKIQISKFLWNHFITNFDPDNHCTYHLRCPCSNCHLLAN